VEGLGGKKEVARGVKVRLYTDEKEGVVLGSVGVENRERAPRLRRWRRNTQV
jgi:hypothetical protein